MVEKLYLTKTELIILKKIMSEFGYEEDKDYRQLNKRDSKETKIQPINFAGDSHVMDKMKSYLRYYIYPFRKKEKENV